MLTSLLIHKKSDRPAHIYILYGELSDISIKKLTRAIKRFNGEVTFIKVDEQLCKDFPLSIGEKHYISKESYYRILIPNLLDEGISKALYLDCDMIVRTDISELWDTNIEEFDLAAVDERTFLTEENIKGKMNRLSLPSDSYYFNAGLLLMNLDRWRAKNIPSEIAEFIQNNPDKLELLDQDALNAVLNNRWLPLDQKWNYFYTRSKKLPFTSAAILHFQGPIKPWNSRQIEKGYLMYLNASLWEQPL